MKNDETRASTRHSLKTLKHFFLVLMKDERRINLGDLLSCLDTTIIELSLLRDECDQSFDGIVEKVFVQYLSISNSGEQYLEGYRVLMPRAFGNIQRLKAYMELFSKILQG